MTSSVTFTIFTLIVGFVNIIISWLIIVNVRSTFRLLVDRLDELDRRDQRRRFP